MHSYLVYQTINIIFYVVARLSSNFDFFCILGAFDYDKDARNFKAQVNTFVLCVHSSLGYDQCRFPTFCIMMKYVNELLTNLFLTFVFISITTTVLG